jgi:hypothetical protein
MLNSTSGGDNDTELNELTVAETRAVFDDRGDHGNAGRKQRKRVAEAAFRKWRGGRLTHRDTPS